jgi:hypothetical protein
VDFGWELAELADEEAVGPSEIAALGRGVPDQMIAFEVGDCRTPGHYDVRIWEMLTLDFTIRM